VTFQPQEEKESERKLIYYLANKLGVRVIRTQDDNDDGGTDGIIEFDNSIRIAVEARRKGYPNHNGKVCYFRDGWNTLCLREGIFLNELTIKRYKGKRFIFLVDINGGSKPKVAIMNSKQVDELLKQYGKWQKSTNSGVSQHVKCVPLSWFQEI
jgi:hypothetical protein